MKNILILADLSDTCNNTLRYAADLACAANAERIILLKSQYVSLYAQLLPSADFVQLSADAIDEERRKDDAALKQMADRLTTSCGADVKIEVATSSEPLLRAVRQVITDHQPDLIMVGSDVPGGDESIVGQQVVAVAKISTVPVLVIPCGASRKPLKRVLVPVDPNAIERLSLIDQLKQLQFTTEPEILVLCVDPEGKRVGHEAENAGSFKQFLQEYEYDVQYTDDDDTVKSILNYASQNEVQLIVALPGKHSFFYNLTHSSITEALTTNSRLPVLILK